MTAGAAGRPAQRRAGRIILAVGVVFAVAGIVLPFILGAVFVSFPGGPVDLTTRAVGQYVPKVNPGTLVPQQQQSQPLRLIRRLRTVETSGGTVILQQDDTEQVGPLPLHFTQRYAIDQDSVRNVASPQAYAYAPGNTVDRSPAYSVNLPLGTGNGPYLMWDDATGQSYRLTAHGSVSQDGLQLELFRGHLSAAPVSPAFLAALAPLGLTSTMTLDQLKPQLVAAGVDVDQLRNVALRQLDSADQAAVNEFIQGPIAVSYLLTSDVQLLVYPATGTIVSVRQATQSLAMLPDIAGIGRIVQILSQPKYSGKTAVTAAAAELTKLIAAPPTTTLFTTSYAQDASSTAAVAAFAAARGSDISTLTFTIPLIIGLIGGVLILVGVVLLVQARRAAAPH